MRAIDKAAITSGVFVVGLFINLASATAATELKQAADAVGLVVLNEVSGSITYCSPAAASTTPIGKCAAIGGIPLKSLLGNGFVSLGNAGNGSVNLATKITSSINCTPFACPAEPTTGSIAGNLDGIAFVGNTVTGLIVECAYQYNGSSGAVSGRCVPVANPVK